MNVTKSLKKGWMESIRHGIICYFQYGVRPDEYGLPEIENVEFTNGEDFYVTHVLKTKQLKERIPCLLVGDGAIAFQVVVDVEFKTCCDGKIFSPLIKNFTIPNKYTHGLLDTEINQLYPVVGDIILDLNNEFKNMSIEYGVEYVDDDTEV